MRVWLALFGLAIVATSPSNARAQGAVQLPPATSWVIESTDHNCRLLRTFGEEENAVTLGLTSHEPGGRFQLSAAGELTRLARRIDAIRLTLSDVESFRARYLQADLDGLPAILVTNPISIGPLPPETMSRLRSYRPVETFSHPAAEEQVTSILFSEGFVQEFEVLTGPMHLPLRALKDCTSRLRAQWGFEAEAQDTLSRVARPRNDPSRWIRMQDLPSELRQPMLINYRLTIDAEGTVAECVVADVAPETQLARTVCESLRKRARFDAARDAEGTPVASYFVTWRDLRR